MVESRQRSPWLYVLLGCLGVVVLIVLVVGALIFFGVRTARQIAADNEDPERRQDRALEILGAERAPAGYHAAGVFSIPFVMDLAVLTDEAPGAEPWAGEFGQRGFYYIRTRWKVEDPSAFFDGESTEPQALQDMGLALDIEENLERGELNRDDVLARWATFRGSTMFDQGEQFGELLTLIEFDCPQDERMRMGIWFGPREEPDPESPADGEPAGAVADNQAIATFLEPIRPCAD